MRKLLYISLFVFVGIISAKAQQSAQFSQYLYNTSSINPAYNGNNDRITMMLTHRSQWVGLDGAPRSQMFTFAAPLMKQKLNAGAYVLNESIGARKFTTAQATGAYHIQMNGSSLSFGIRAGIVSWNIDQAAITYENSADPSSLTNASNSIIPNFDAGIFYNGQKFFIGASSFNLTEPQFFSTITGNGIESANKLNRHYFMLTGYRFSLNKNLVFRPSVFAKYTAGSLLNYDINMALIIKERFHTAITYRSSKMISAMLQFYLNSHLHAGYSFDYTFSDIKTFATAGTHEIFIGYDIFQKARPMVTPRFL